MAFKIKVNGQMVKWGTTKKERFSKPCPGEKYDGGRAVLPREEKAKMGSLSGKHRKLSEGKVGP